MRIMCLSLCLLLLVSCGQSSADQAQNSYDVVIVGGRVIDPESGLDAIRNVGINADTIAVVTTEELNGKTILEASGQIVAPGFIDLHAHSINLPGYRMQALQGVTTSLELESGILPIDQWYDDQSKKNLPIHYGASVAWTFARIATYQEDQPEASLSYFQKAQARDDWKMDLANAEQLQKIRSLVAEGLDQGGLGIGINAGYAPGYGRKEYYELAQLANEYQVGTFTHVRYSNTNEPNSSFEAIQELISNAAITGTPMHICHINSSSQKDIKATLQIYEQARMRGVPVTAGTYPWGAASTVIGAAMFSGPDWREVMQTSEEKFQLGSERMTAEQFKSVQDEKPGTLVTWHFLDEDVPSEKALFDLPILHPEVLIESDAMPWEIIDEMGTKQVENDTWPLPEDAFSHPRSSASFTRILQEFVRERKLMSLLEAVNKMSLMPAQTLEAYVPQMKRKGRLQPGMDADILVFDLDKIKVKADYVQPYHPSEGMNYVFVMGEPIITEGELILNAHPGQAIRRAQKK